MYQDFVSLGERYPALRLEIRYATAHNLAGEPLDGYLAPKALCTHPAAEALGKALHALQGQGMGLLIYDAYRPQKAVDHLCRWGAAPEDARTKAEFYPELEKADLFALGYIARKSGHSRGSTLDLTLTNEAGEPLEMGTGFDWMGEASHHGFADLPREAIRRRALLRQTMEAAGFVPYENEWWHYRLDKEPFPETYFNFDIL